MNVTKFDISRRERVKRQAQALLGFGLACALMATCTEAAALDQAHDARPDNHWLKEHLLDVKAQLPVSFVYDRESSSTLLKTWPKKVETKELDNIRTEHIVRWIDPKSGLQVRIEALEFANSPVVEWTAYFKNDGKAEAPILEYVQALDVSFAVAGEGIPTILYSKGW